jgi:autotransporter-associated beta strand protein
MGHFTSGHLSRCLRLSREIVFCLIALICATGISRAQGTKPNIVLILSDDAGYNEFGFSSAAAGQTTQFETPNLDALAQRSVVARNGYAPAPLCSPTRAGLLTGRYQQRFGFDYNLDHAGQLPNEGAIPANELTIADHLKTLGYTTGVVGKWHVGYEEGVNLPNDKGFDEFYGIWGGGRDYFADWHPSRIIRKQTQDYESQYRAGGNPAEYDPIRGRYVTDAFGDEAADFVSRHAGNDEPFFLYMTPISPHTPHQPKQQDLEHFAHISDGGVQIRAAMSYSLDRSVGKVLDAIDDPNGDGDTSDSVRDNTIIVFINDNGGTNINDNTPFAGNKGLTWEGGIRVPFMIHVPGVEPGVYDKPVTGYDVLPTVYAAAGGNVAQLSSDGVDLVPYLSGENEGTPHETLFWRTNNIWAVRKGDWKLGDYTGAGFPPALFNLATDRGEKTNVAAQNPEIVADLLHELTQWEATLDKPLWGIIAGNPIDHFVYQGGSFGFWNAGGLWQDPLTGNPVTMTRADGYANTILEFRTRNTSSYASSNNLTRMTKQEFMLNEIRFTGNFTGSSAHFGKVQDNSLVFVKNLAGEGPKIRIDATSSGTPFQFDFLITNEMSLLDDLEITGNGTQPLFIAGNLRDYVAPRGVTKTGTSQVILAGNNTFHGKLTILGGQVRLTRNDPRALPVGAINGASSIVIGSAGAFAMDSGLVNVPLIDNSDGGQFQFTGGELRVTDFLGNLTNQGGNYSPGASPAISNVTGDFAQPSGKLTIELAGTTPGNGYDQLIVNGTASLGGTLEVDLLNGFVPPAGVSLDILRALGGINGTFANTSFPNVPGITWQLAYEPLAVRLLVNAAVINLPGDFNFNGVVDAADYSIWRNSVGATGASPADGDGNGIVDNEDYAIWRANFGKTAPPPGSASALGTIPEPNALVLSCLAAAMLLARRRSR